MVGVLVWILPEADGQVGLDMEEIYLEKWRRGMMRDGRQREPSDHDHDRDLRAKPENRKKGLGASKSNWISRLLLGGCGIHKEGTTIRRDPFCKEIAAFGSLLWAGAGWGKGSLSKDTVSPQTGMTAVNQVHSPWQVLLQAFGAVCFQCCHVPTRC